MPNMVNKGFVLYYCINNIRLQVQYVIYSTNSKLFCCFLRYHSIVQSRWYCHVVAIITSTFHLMGTIMFVGGEVLDNFKHLPSVSYKM